MTKEQLSASALISRKIADLGDWRGETLARMRKLIHEADPNVVEDWKWGGPVWSPKKLFNSSLDGNVRRALDIPEGEEVDAAAFKALFREAVAANGVGRAKPKKPK